MSRPLDTQHLQTLATVVRTGSFHAAAEILCCVPSAVSGRMKALAEQVGTPLFVQDGRRVRPTPAGETLARYAGMILSLCDRALEEVASGDPARSPLRLGVIDTVAGADLPAWLRCLKGADPELPIVVETGHSIPLVERVLDGALDAAFVAGIWERRELVQEAAVPEHLVLIVPRHADDRARRTALALPCPCTYRARLEQWAGGEGAPIDELIELGSAEAVIGGVAAGLGFSLMPASALRHSRFRNVIDLKSVPPAFGDIPTTLVRNRDMPRHPGLDALLAALNQGHEGALDMLTGSGDEGRA